jgi:hypothetical protein
VLYYFWYCIENNLMWDNSQVDSSIYASIIFGKTSRNKRNGLTADLSGYMLVDFASLHIFLNQLLAGGNGEKRTSRPASDVVSARAPGPGLTGDDDAAWKSMITAFGALSLSTIVAAKKRRLPFLRRIVRNSFFRRCQTMGLAVDPVSPPTQLLTVLYKMAIEVSDDESDNDVTEFAVYEVKVAFDKLVCPLCDTIGRLISKEMLEAHLEWDHSEVEASWRKRPNGVSCTPPC